MIVRELEEQRGNDENETDIGLDLLAGIGWKTAGVVPYLQAKVILSDETEAVLAAGIRF